MKIGIANDHHGIELKRKIMDYLDKHHIDYVNYGCDVRDNVDYVDYAIELCKNIQEKKVDLGILICGTGIGMSIVANKMKGIIAARVVSAEDARLCREHNMANVMTLAEKTEDLENILDKFINTLPSTEERHKRRVEKILNL